MGQVLSEVSDALAESVESAGTGVVRVEGRGRLAASGMVIGVAPGLPETPAAGGDWIAAGLRLRSGNSGGPMMDARGDLVGINTIMTGPSVAIAVPVHSVKRFLQEALQAESARA